MVVFDTSLREIKIHKRRGHKLSKNVKINYGEYAIVSTNESKIELIQFTIFKRMIKKLVKKRKKIKSKGKVRSNQVADSKSKTKNYKIWFNLLPNYVISKKSKNARMGKGKGGFVRWIFRLQQGVTLVEFLGIPFYRLKHILLFLQKKMKIKLTLIKNNSINDQFSSWSKLNTSLKFFNKFRYN